MEKNTAGKWIVFAYGLPDHANDGQPITGDAANITANVRIDGGAANAVDDTNPTELEDGYYIFDITAAEANGDNILLTPVSSTANVQVIAVPGAVWTRPANFNDFSITATTGRTDLDSVAGVSQTGGDISALITTVDTVVDGIQNDLDNGTDGLGAIKAETALIVADTNELQTDDYPTSIAALQTDLDTLTAGVTLTAAGIDAIIDETLTSHVTADSLGVAIKDILVDTSTTLQAELDAIQAAVITNAAGVDVAADIIAIKAETALIVADTNELQTDDIPTTLATLATTTELNKVPKSDGTSSWNATALAAINAEADTALADYDGPTNTEMEARTPTAAQLAYIVANAATGLPVVFTTAGGATTTAVLNTVDGSAASATNDQYNGRLLVFTDGTLAGVVTDITDYVGSTTTATITAIPFAPTSSHNARLI